MRIIGFIVVIFVGMIITKLLGFSVDESLFGCVVGGGVYILMWTK